MPWQRSTIGSLLTLLLFAFQGVNAEPYYQGVKPCESCHAAEVEVWEGTVHAKSYKTLHKSEKAKALLSAVGTEESMKRDPLCISCHYSLRQKSASAKPKAKEGPSCESCHGPSSDWIDLHNDYGDFASAEEEPAEHRRQRLANAEAAGMIGAFNIFGIASNCTSCHGLSRPDVDGDSLAAMFANGHPLNGEFELVEYSQGSVRHRFYPPDLETNAEMSIAEQSRLFVIGKAAQIVAADRAVALAPDGDYKAAQQAIAAAARNSLAAVKDNPAVSAFLANPGEESGRTLAAELEKIDLSKQVGGLLPTSFK